MAPVAKGENAIIPFMPSPVASMADLQAICFDAAAKALQLLAKSEQEKIPVESLTAIVSTTPVVMTYADRAHFVPQRNHVNRATIVKLLQPIIPSTDCRRSCSAALAERYEASVRRIEQLHGHKLKEELGAEIRKTFNITGRGKSGLCGQCIGTLRSRLSAIRRLLFDDL